MRTHIACNNMPQGYVHVELTDGSSPSKMAVHYLYMESEVVDPATVCAHCFSRGSSADVVWRSVEQYREDVASCCMDVE